MPHSPKELFLRYRALEEQDDPDWSELQRLLRASAAGGWVPARAALLALLLETVAEEFWGVAEGEELAFGYRSDAEGYRALVEELRSLGRGLMRLSPELRDEDWVRGMDCIVRPFLRCGELGWDPRLEDLVPGAADRLGEPIPVLEWGSRAELVTLSGWLAERSLEHAGLLVEALIRDDHPQLHQDLREAELLILAMLEHSEGERGYEEMLILARAYAQQGSPSSLVQARTLLETLDELERLEEEDEELLQQLGGGASTQPLLEKEPPPQEDEEGSEHMISLYAQLPPSGDGFVDPHDLELVEDRGLMEQLSERMVRAGMTLEELDDCYCSLRSAAKGFPYARFMTFSAQHPQVIFSLNSMSCSLEDTWIQAGSIQRKTRRDPADWD